MSRHSRSHRNRPVRRVFASLVAVVPVAAAALTGCAGEQIPPEEKEAINTGVNAGVGAIEADNLLIITTAEDEPGRLLGLLMTASEEPLEVTFADADEEITVTVPPEADPEEPEGFSFEENEHVFQTTETRPGAMATITVSVEGESAEVNVPVFDGSLERYSPFVP